MPRGRVAHVRVARHFAPPLVATRDAIDRMVAIADECLTITEREFAGEFEA
jgi:hypothetical protein